MPGTLEIVPVGTAGSGVTSVPQGGSITFDVIGEDAFGNPVDKSKVVLTSSVASDVVSGLTVNFPHASPHVITATIGAVTATVKIEVIPWVIPAVEPKPDVPAAASPTVPSTSPALSNTGQSGDESAMAVTAALALVILGAVLVVARRRATV